MLLRKSCWFLPDILEFCNNVKKILERETDMPGNEVSEKKFDFDRTLDEMNRDIIHRELERMNGNQSATAKKLGISRTTLWRYLKQ